MSSGALPPWLSPGPCSSDCGVALLWKASQAIFPYLYWSLKWHFGCLGHLEPPFLVAVTTELSGNEPLPGWLCPGLAEAEAASQGTLTLLSVHPFCFLPMMPPS